MERTMSLSARQELTNSLAGRYRQANRLEKKRILDEFTATTGYHRKYAVSLLKHQVPIRTFADWDDLAPGFLEADLVAHCGTTTQGAYLSSLTLTDVATTWTECLALQFHGEEAVLAGLEQGRQLFPFPILGLDTDNGSEFINGGLLHYCRIEKITFTRCRPYKKNDQCHVEQKNGAMKATKHVSNWPLYTACCDSTTTSFSPP